jgi:hypothetical protein
MTVLFWILGIFNVANGVWMLASPETWYLYLPAAVPDTGPLNVHFVRDIGAAFTTFGIGLCAGAVSFSIRRVTLAGATLFFGLHALIHVVDILSGRLHAGHWLIDLPGVLLPAALLVVLCFPRWWRSQRAS